MFFKVWLSALTTLIIVVCINMFFVDSHVSTPLVNEVRMEVVQIPQQVEVLTQAKEECKSYIATEKGKVCVRQGVPTDNSDRRDEIVLPPPIISEDFSIPKYFNYPEDGPTVQDKNAQIDSSTNTDTPKVVPGAVFIPFYFKSCLWSCK